MSLEQHDQLAEVERLFAFVSGSGLLSETDLDRLAAIIAGTRERLGAGESQPRGANMSERFKRIEMRWTAALLDGWNIQDQAHAQEDIPWLLSRVGELEEGLREYGQHRSGCGYWQRASQSLRPCTCGCGLMAMLADEAAPTQATSSERIELLPCGHERRTWSDGSPALERACNGKGCTGPHSQGLGPNPRLP